MARLSDNPLCVERRANYVGATRNGVEQDTARLVPDIAWQAARAGVNESKRSTAPDPRPMGVADRN
jgi:hypothetical protein